MGAVNSHFFKPQRLNLVRGCGSLSHDKCSKNRISILANLYQKYQFWRFWQLLSHKGEIWHEGADLGLPPQAKFGENRLRGIPLLEKLYQKLAISAILAHIVRVTIVKFGVRVRAWDSLPAPNFI